VLSERPAPRLPHREVRRRRVVYSAARERPRDIGARSVSRGGGVGESSILILGEDDFDERIARLEGPILVDFWAAWCAPCKTIAPLLEQFAEEMEGRVHVAKIDVDENGDLANRFGIRSIPTLIVFKKGKVVDQLVGAVPKDQIRRMVEKHLG
jgi:thioredoxin 1